MTAATTLSLHPPTRRYTGVAIALHWLLALLIVGNFSVGYYMADLPFSPSRLKLYNWHKWAGMTILTLSALRLLWRLAHRPPVEPPMPGWQRWSAQAVHWALYACFFLAPLSGWAYSSAAGFPIVWFGVLPLPDLVHADPALAEVLKLRHWQFTWALAILVALHVAAALKHQLLDRDHLIARMWPGDDAAERGRTLHEPSTIR